MFVNQYVKKSTIKDKSKKAKDWKRRRLEGLEENRLKEEKIGGKDWRDWGKKIEREEDWRGRLKGLEENRLKDKRKKIKDWKKKD